MKQYIKAESVIRKTGLAGMIMSSFIQGTQVLNGDQALSKENGNVITTWDDDEE